MGDLLCWLPRVSVRNIHEHRVAVAPELLVSYLVRINNHFTGFVCVKCVGIKSETLHNRV